MAYDSKNLLVWVKAMSRGQNLPLDASEIHESYSAAETYAASPTAYPGQTIKALVDGKYKSYVLQPSEAGYTLEEVGAIKASDLKQYVQMPTSLPTEGQEQGVLYIVGTTGSIWDGTKWLTVFYDVEEDLEAKADVESPNFTGTVTVNNEEVAVKSYVEGLISNIVSSAPGIVDSDNALPTENYKAGQTFRVAEAGTYVGAECEVGDLIIVVADYKAETASNADFMVVQANIDGAVTSTSDVTTVGEIVVFDAVTGKVIKGSGVNIGSLNDAISKSHEHTNKTQLDTYDKTQTELLETAKSEAQGIVDAYKTTVNEALDLKANESDVEASLKTITDNLNTKVDSDTVDGKISEAKTEFLDEAATNASTALEERLGGIPADTTVQSYIDTAVGSGGTASATAIATAKQEAIDTSKTYTDEQISAALTIVEF